MAIVLSSKHEKWESLTVIRLLHSFSTFLGVSIPNLYNFRSFSLTYAIYVVITCILLIIYCTICEYYRIAVFYEFTLPPTVRIMDVLTMVSATATNIVCKISAAFIRRKQHIFIMKTIKDVENSMEIFNERISFYKPITSAQLIIISVFVMCTTIYDTWNALTIGIFWMTAIWTYNYVCLSAVVMQINVLGNRIGYIFHFMNKRLSENMEYGTRFGLNNHKLAPSKCNVDMIFFLRNYNTLCDVIDVISKGYGLQILCIIINVILTIIHNLNLVMKIAIHLSQMTMKVTILVSIITDTSLYILFTLVITMSSTRMAQNAKRTADICYKLVLNYPSTLKSHQEMETKEELILLSEHLTQRQVHFSADGLFIVDYSMLLTVFGSIATYLVIILQFK